MGIDKSVVLNANSLYDLLRSMLIIKRTSDNNKLLLFFIEMDSNNKKKDFALNANKLYLTFKNTIKTVTNGYQSKSLSCSNTRYYDNV